MNELLALYPVARMSEARRPGATCGEAAPGCRFAHPGYGVRNPAQNNEDRWEYKPAVVEPR